MKVETEIVYFLTSY